MPDLACRRVPSSVCSVPGWACLWHGVTFEHRQVLPWAVKGEGISVNEAVYTGAVGLDGRRR
jgi:hypothetical protein